jgi:hypothetical protein
MVDSDHPKTQAAKNGCNRNNNLKVKEKTMAHDIFEKRKERERDAKLFRSLTGKEASELIARDPAEYARLKAADRAGDPNPQSGVRRSGIPMNKYVGTENVPSDLDLEDMLLFPPSECHLYYVKAGNVKTPDHTHIIARLSPQAQESLRNAAVLHKIIPGEVRRRKVDVPVLKVEKVENDRVAAGELGKAAGLSPEIMVTKDQLRVLEAREAKRIASRSPLQVAEDNAADIRRMADLATKAAADLKAKS